MARSVRTFRDLDAWRMGLENVVAVYRIARLLPADERFVLSAQMRRAAISIPANIAEGHARRSGRAYLNHLNIALGSQAELETEIEVARRLDFIDAISFDEMDRMAGRLRPLLHALRIAIARHHNLDDSV